MTEMLLSVKGLSAFYGQAKVLDEVDLDLVPGTITTLLGSNGAGKTTTLRALCGMIRTRGSMVFRGQPIQRLATEAIVRLGIAHVPDGRGTFGEFTVEENLRLGAITRSDSNAVEEDMERMYGYFPRLRERHRQQAGTLSGGEQQMLAISRALMLRPHLMLLDEPSFGLAPQIVRELFGLIRTINREQGTTILLVEQNAALTLEFADSAYLMEVGRIVLAGTAAELKDNEIVRNAYLGH